MKESFLYTTIFIGGVILFLLLVLGTYEILYKLFNLDPVFIWLITLIYMFLISLIGYLVL